MSFVIDSRQSWRGIVRSPGYALTCIAVLALGIGAATAIFSMLHSIVLSALPYPDSDRLVFVWERFPNIPPPVGDRVPVARRNYLEWKRQTTVFSDMAVFHEAELAESGVDRPRHVSVGSVSANLFNLLGATARLGRLFPPDAEAKGSDRVAVLTHSYFESRYQGDPKTIGRQIAFDGATYTVIGVLQPGFHLPAMWEGLDQKKPDVWVPLTRLWTKPEADRERILYVIAKMRPDASLERARTEMTAIAARLSQSDPKLNDGWKASVFPLAVEDAAPTLHRAIYVLFVAVLFLLLIACANLANLSLARASGRTREFAVRLALGAGRGRIAVQMLTESLIIAIVGAAAGLLLAHWALAAMMALKPSEFQRPELIGINWQVFAFAVAVSVLTALLFGLGPAINASRQDLNTAMKASGIRGASAARSWTRQALIATEVALALVLVTGAGLMIQSFKRLVDTGVGLRTERLATLDVFLPELQYPNAANRSRFYRELMERARALPGVDGASWVDNLPLHRISMQGFYIVGRPEPTVESTPVADFAQAGPGYMEMMGIRLLAGRYFTERDVAVNDQGKDGVTIVSQSWARKFLDGVDPLGQRITNTSRTRTYEIVGVVADSRPMGVENGVRPQIYWPSLDSPSGTLIVQTRGVPDSLAKALQDAVWSIDKSLPLNKVETMEEQLHEFQSQREFNTLLMAVFAGLALLLAMIGIYGVLANQVGARTREIGIRVAIGAQARAIARLVLAQSMIPVAIGVVVGLAGSWVLSRFVGALLYGVQATDPVSRALGVLVVLLIVPLAVFVPLRRALRISCTEALREE